KQVMGEEADKRGDRFTAPSDVWKAYRALETKLSSGEYKPIVAKPANDAAPEDVAAYRKSIGAPEKAEGYLENLPKGLVVDADAPLLNKFVERMHASHAPTELVQTAIQSYFDVQQAVNADLVEQDQSAQQRVTDDLYGEWGNETRANLNAVGGFLRTTFGNELAEQIEHARLADGTKLGNSKETIEAFLRIAKDMNPAATIVPGVGGSSAQGIEQRLGELRKMQAENPKAYWNNDKVQDEERQLIEAQQRMNARSA
ncbi:MAG: hypothetical protein ACREDC_11360, partial [Bradyrhizobium sp.]